MTSQAEQDGGTKSTLLQQATPVVTSAVHQQLTELPQTPGLTIAVIVIFVNVVFAVVMTGYSYVFDCKHKLGMLDADWDAQERSSHFLKGGIDFDPYKNNFQPPTYICGSFARRNETGCYEEPCLLTDLKCGQYKDKRCPDFMLTVVDYCDSDIPQCAVAAYDSLVSVAYMDCPSFFVALGATLSYVTYVQAVFQNRRANPAMAYAHLYWESLPYAPLGYSDQPVAAQSFPGHRWSIRVDGKTVAQAWESSKSRISL